jgi:D-glycero-D-manno-heptose 1,7-bisphosphate phosphatase
MDNCLIIIDRDGTLIENHAYLGKEDNWKTKVKLIDKTVFLLKSLNVLYPDNLKIVFSNQTGVALGYFSEKTVEKINDYVSCLLSEKDIEIKYWIYSPEADKTYAEQKGVYVNRYIKPVSNRKPNPQLLQNKLKELDLSFSSFKRRIVIGDSEDDELLAEKIKAFFIQI